ncbi:MAG: hypothetical protein GY820_03945 [Gammaproteobacteria bacterium]|nr:hypothetical protein [Gammaproteobacteria bacterium]
MRKIIYSIIGAVLGGIACNVLFWGIGQLAILLDIRLYNSEDEASRNFLIFLIMFFISVIGGAVIGFIVGKRTSNINVTSTSK